MDELEIPFRFAEVNALTYGTVAGRCTLQLQKTFKVMGVRETFFSDRAYLEIKYDLEDVRFIPFETNMSYDVANEFHPTGRLLGRRLTIIWSYACESIDLRRKKEPSGILMELSFVPSHSHCCIPPVRVDNRGNCRYRILPPIEIEQ